MRARPAWIATIRADQWWTFKLVPSLTAIYAAKLRADAPIVGHWPDLVALLIALGSGAAAISLINDAFDRDDDRAAGKTNRLEFANPVHIVLLLLPHALVAACMTWWWHKELPILLVYAAIWLSFLLYSVPPVRLKRRGFAGALADAAGASMLPVLLAALVGATGKGDLPLLIVLGLWSLAYGVRGIVWHQLEDAENDRRSGIATYVVRVGEQRARQLVRRFVFPVELTGLIALIAVEQSLAAAIVLCLYLRTVGPMKGHYRRRPAIIAAGPHTVPLLYDFYLVLIPLVLLLESTLRHPSDALALGLHLILFVPGWLPYLSEMWHWRKR